MTTMELLASFNSTDVTYNIVGDHEIELSILTPKDLSPGKAHPVVVRFHGGALVTGSRTHEEWMPRWLLSFVLATPAILINPDYRLLPESNGDDILSDIRALWKHIRTELPFTLSTLGIEADLTRILVTGESAGGYIAAQSVLLHPPSSSFRISAAALVYGMLDLKSRFYTEPHVEGRERPMMGAPPQPPDLIDKHLARVKAGVLPSVVSAATPPDRLELSLAIMSQAGIPRFLGEASELYPMENLERVGKDQVPPMWLLHGGDDTVAPLHNSEGFAQKTRELHPEAEVLLTVVPGKEHGFENEEGVGLETEWLKEGVQFLNKFWP